MHALNHCFVSQKDNFRLAIHYKAGGLFQEGGATLGQGDEELLHRTCNRNNGKGQACPYIGCLLLQAVSSSKFWSCTFKA